MIKVFDTVKEFEDYSINGLKSGELCYVSEDKVAHFKTNSLEDVVPEEDNQYTEAVISQGAGVHLNIKPGDSFEVYNPEHTKLMLYCTTADDMYASAGTMGKHEHMYYTCASHCVWFESINPAWFNIALEPSINGSHTIYYRIID
jgi:hypothetical protein